MMKVMMLLSVSPSSLLHSEKLTRVDKAPGPPKGTGYHRYIFVLLEGDNSNLTAPADRQHWGFEKEGHGVWHWAKEEGLDVVGANWFKEKQNK